MKGLQRSLSRGPKVTAQVVREKIVIDKTLTFTGVTDTVVRQEAVIGDFPEGNILLLGAVARLTFTGPTSANLTNDWEGDVSIGSAPNANTALQNAEVDIIPATALGPASSEVVAATRIANATQVVLDNTDGSLEINLNMMLDGNEVTNEETAAIRVTGTLDLAYIVLGDD